jgi:hypothetical protein
MSAASTHTIDLPAGFSHHDAYNAMLGIVSGFKAEWDRTTDGYHFRFFSAGNLTVTEAGPSVEGRGEYLGDVVITTTQMIVSCDPVWKILAEML